MLYSGLAVLAGGLFALTNAATIAQIKGDSFLSPLAGQVVYNVTGIVTAKDRYGLWLTDEPSRDGHVSSSLRVFGSTVAVRNTRVGDKISLSGTVTEYRKLDRPDDLSLTELSSPGQVIVHSTGHKIDPVVLGHARIPPTGPLSSLDVGSEGWLSVPGNVSLLTDVNPTLQPTLYGLDFWESLEGRLVTIPNPVALDFPSWMGAIWVRGDWPVQGLNKRGGLTIVNGKDDIPYAHSEAIPLGRPLDGSRNPKSTIGVKFENITGIVTYQFGFYTILPLTAPAIVSVPDEEPLPSSIIALDDPCELTIGDYNVENMSPRSHHISKVANHIANYLNAPDIMFLQEIQSDSGSTDNGIVTANKTLKALTNAIERARKGVRYEFVNIEPEDNVDGGKPGSNIRVAYLWRPERVSLVGGSPRGNATQATEAIKGKDEKLSLSLNPGRINPLSPAWEDSRKPLAAMWQTTTGEHFYTVNVHFSSKRGSSPSHGNPRPPVNGHNARRTYQVNVTADFISTLLQHSPNASVILAGDMNEYLQTRSVFHSFNNLLFDINELSSVSPTERYTYVYEQHTQEIDHIFVSESVAKRGTEVEHIHVNTWAKSVGERASDHDPTVARVRVCESRMKMEGVVEDSSTFNVQLPLGL
ncbi:DNase I-like protein [Irpex rosettiformis]|uniref:DNase I-like protein n=1 Tax=Irpex rosettiformis TaxID=378272 RepID=A0ACB8U8Y7_9APHY|nr:DNase I-like protein [Irpex rosettiformis]